MPLAQKILLAVDIGNTQITLGLFQSEPLIARWRIATDVHKTSDEYTLLLAALIRAQNVEKVTDAILVSVVPTLTPTMNTALRNAFSIDALIVTHRLKTGLQIRYAAPEELGTDRIVNAVAAYHLYGGPIIIVDFGTATTFCAVSESGDYLGGAIAPGLATSAEALFTRASQLPRVALRKPKQALCTDTVTGMQSGILFGYVGLVNEMIQRIRDEMGWVANVIATGGLCEWIAPECKSISHIQPNLTLDGLRLLYDMNHSDCPGRSGS